MEEWIKTWYIYIHTYIVSICVCVRVCVYTYIHTHTMEYYLAIKKNKILPFETIRMERLLGPNTNHKHNPNHNPQPTLLAHEK